MLLVCAKLLAVTLLWKLCDSFVKTSGCDDKICEIRVNCTGRATTNVIYCDNPEIVKAMYLDFNSIESLDSESFKQFVNLNTLFVRNNRIVRIANDTFLPLTKIYELSLRNNKVKTISESLFPSMAELFRVDLENNTVTNIPQDTFAKNGRLQQVYLSNNRIEEIHEDSFGKNSKLRLFYVSENNISDISFVKNLHHLGHLDLSSNSIAELPPEAFLEQKQLLRLDLSYNKLKVLPSGIFGELSALESLNLSNNQITYLGENPFDNLPKLRVVNLQSNLLQRFSYHDFGKRVVEVFIDDNRWECTFVSELLKLDKAKLIYRSSKHVPSVKGVPCWEAVTTKKPTTTTSAPTLKIANSTTSILYTVSRSALLESSTEKEEVLFSEPSANMHKESQTANVNTFLYISLTVVSTMIIIIIAISAVLTRRHCRLRHAKKGDNTLDGYMTPASPPPRCTNLYLNYPQEEYEEVFLDNLSHLYEEID